MILANDFLEYLLNTERDLAARVRDRYDMYLKSLPVPQLADGKIHDQQYRCSVCSGEVIKPGQ